MKELYKEMVCIAPEGLDQRAVSANGWHPRVVREASNSAFDGSFEGRDGLG